MRCYYYYYFINTKKKTSIPLLHFLPIRMRAHNIYTIIHILFVYNYMDRLVRIYDMYYAHAYIDEKRPNFFFKIYTRANIQFQFQTWFRFYGLDARTYITVYIYIYTYNTRPEQQQQADTYNIQDISICIIHINYIYIHIHKHTQTHKHA